MLFNQFPEYAFQFFHAGAPRILRDTKHQCRFRIDAEVIKKAQCRFDIRAVLTKKSQTRFDIRGEITKKHQTLFDIYVPETVTN